MMINGEIETSFIVVAESGELYSEIVVDIPFEELHKIYATEELYGIISDGDLIGQTKKISKGDDALDYLPREGAFLERGKELFLVTYWAVVSDEEIISCCNYFLEGFEKDGEERFVFSLHLKDVDLVWLRRILGRPKRDSLAGCFTLSSSVQAQKIMSRFSMTWSEEVIEACVYSESKS